MTQEQTTPVVDLDAIMDDALAKFDGEQKENALEVEQETPESVSSKEPGPAPKAEDTDEHPEKEHKQPESTEKEETPLKPDKSEQDYRFKTREDAEKGYKEIQREKTRLEGELKTQREEMESLKTAEAKKTQTLEFEKDTRAFAKEKNLAALKKIDALDPDAEDYQDQVAEIQADTYRDISRYERDKLDKGQTGKTQTPTETDIQSAKTRVREVAEENSIDPDDEYFSMVCKTAPIEDEAGKPMDFEEQIIWAINKTKNYQGSFDTGDKEKLKQHQADQRARQNQEANLSLGKATSAVHAKDEKDNKPLSLNDALESAFEERRL